MGAWSTESLRTTGGGAGDPDGSLLTPFPGRGGSGVSARLRTAPSTLPTRHRSATKGCMKAPLSGSSRSESGWATLAKLALLGLLVLVVMLHVIARTTFEEPARDEGVGSGCRARCVVPTSATGAAAATIRPLLAATATVQNVWHLPDP